MAPRVEASSEARRGMELLALPSELLRLVIEQQAIGPRELCSLEMSSAELRRLINKETWKRAFMLYRHDRAINEICDWKKEFARRDAWSRGWRKLDRAGMSCFALPTVLQTEKLRRFAVKIMTGNSPVVTLKPRNSVLVVDASMEEEGCFKTICSALAVAQPFDKILVRPGVYCEALKLERSVEIVGSGTIGSTVIDSVDGPTIEVANKISFRLSNLCIQQHLVQVSERDLSGAIMVKCSGVAIIEECSISSETGHGLVIKGSDTFAYIMHNIIHDTAGVGVLFCESSKGLVDDNVICNNGRAGVAILSGANPVVSANKIHDGLDSGVLISEKGRGRVERNDIIGNQRAGVAINKEGAPLVLRNRIHDGHDSGVLVCHKGRGSVTENVIDGNEMAGVAVGRDGAAEIVRNIIGDGNSVSLCLSLHSKGRISSNFIYQGSKAAMQVPELMMPDMRKHNHIKDGQEL